MTLPINKEQRTWGMVCHLAAFVGYVIPFGHLIGPLVVWLLKKDKMPFVADQGRESLNFQITMSIGYLIGFVLHLILVGWLVLTALFLINVLFVVMATLATNEGKHYRYPISLRLVK